jgi:hypothetical protein
MAFSDVPQYERHVRFIPKSRVFASCRINCAMNQATCGKLCGVGDVGVVKPPFQFQHCADALEKYSAPIGIDLGGGGHHGFELIVGQTQHAAQDIPAPRYNANHADAAMISARLEANELHQHAVLAAR